jgi:hypothetical protein
MINKINIFNNLLPNTFENVKVGVIPFWNRWRKKLWVLPRFRNGINLLVCLLAFTPARDLFSHHAEMRPEIVVMNDIFSIDREIGFARASQHGLDASDDGNGMPFTMNRNHSFDYPNFLKANKYRVLLESIKTHHRHHCALEAENLLEYPSSNPRLGFTHAIQIIHNRAGLAAVQKRR